VPDVIIPVLNEAAALPALLAAMPPGYRPIVVDNGSKRTTGELAAALGVSAPAASRHLSVLEHAGVVTSRREGQRVLYGLVRDAVVEALAGFAAELAAGAGPARPRKPREAI